ncbi:MAG: hypothetical protein HY582_04690 [Candidatus Omnitrophica bacterium]|nr:hypothetical protein [Candidatus Omnitrophota bacterium]
MIDIATYYLLHYLKPILIVAIIASLVNIFLSRHTKKSGEWITLWILFGTLGFTGLQAVHNYEAFLESRKPNIGVSVDSIRILKDEKDFKTILNSDGNAESKLILGNISMTNYGEIPALIKKIRLSFHKNGQNLDLTDPTWVRLPLFVSQTMQHGIQRPISLKDFQRLQFEKGSVRARIELEYQAMADQIGPQSSRDYHIWLDYDFNAKSDTIALIDGDRLVSGNIKKKGDIMSFVKFMADWGFWDIIGLLGAAIPSILLLWYIFPRKAINNLYVDTRRGSVNTAYPKVIWVELRNHTNKSIYVFSEGFDFGTIISLAPNAAKDAATGRCEIKFEGRQPGILSDIDTIVRPNQTISTWVPVNPSHSDPEIDAALSQRQIGTLHLKCQKLTSARNSSIKLKIPV